MTRSRTPGDLPNVMEMSPTELDHLMDPAALANIQKKSARRHQRSSSNAEDHSPRYGKIEQKFLPKSAEKRGLVPQRAHKIVVRNGRLVDVTEEEEDKLAITAVKKAEEHARERQHVSAISPLRSPRDFDRVLLPRSPRGCGRSRRLCS